MVHDPLLVTRETRLAAFEPPLSWSAIIAGAAVALATSILLTLFAAGFGYDLAMGDLASPASLKAFTPEVGAGAVAIQVISAGIGGYLAGRLRPGWPSAHLDEAHFRDTAQGVIAWALATVIGLILAAALLTPYAERLAATVAVSGPPPELTADDAVRAGHVLAQSAFFTALGMLVSAFIAAVAARLGGLRTEEMHEKGRA
ncbi:MAG TPA: hypothetical protein VJP88_07545 [Caulobacteraceae bacterium]|nr:hypothetical protein [Caulobacteraceae bacterium]